MTNKKDAPIGVFDSGMGGISVLRELVKIMPNEDYIFFGDSANAPYGIKTVEEVQKLSFEKVEHLLSYNCKAIVVACNTATSAAIKELRAAYPDLIIVGLEPALKPAVEHKKDSKVGVMATPLTLKEKKFKVYYMEYDSPVLSRVPYDENKLVEDAVVNIEDACATMPISKSVDNLYNILVAATKKMIVKLFPQEGYSPWTLARFSLDWSALHSRMFDFNHGGGQLCYKIS